MEKKRIHYAVSELVGVVLLLAIVTSVMALIFYQVSTDKGPDKQAFVKLVGKIEGEKFIVEHEGGESLSLDTSISIAYAGKKYNFTAGDIVVDTNHNGFWDLGEKMIFPFTYDLKILSKYDTMDMMSVDKESNSIQFLGSVKFRPVVDLGLRVTVSNPTPLRYDYIYTNLTLTCHGGDIDGSANIKVKYLLPVGLQYYNSNSTVGTYNNTTGIWSIDQFTCNQSVNLSIRSRVISAGTREYIQFALILDGSASISSTNWTVIKRGLSSVLANSNLFPNDGSVELTVVQFGKNTNKCKVEISPRNVTTSNFQSIADYINNSGYDPNKLIQGAGGTPMAAGIYNTTDTMRNSKNFNATKKQIVLMITDGQPTYWSVNHEYVGHGTGGTVDPEDLQATENASNYLVTHLEMTEGKDQFVAFGIGNSSNITWLNNSIVWPQPGYIAPPFNNTGRQGWVSLVYNYNQFAARISQIFKILFQSIPLKAEIISSFTVDPNSLNNIDIEIINPG